MRVKTFRGPDAKAVLSRIKSELGPEAVILSNQTVVQDGQNICEIMAALDTPAQPAPGVSRPIVPPPTETRNDPPRRRQRQVGFGDWHTEWLEIREHLLALIKPQINLDQLSPRQRLALEYLEREGVDLNVILTIFREIQYDAEASVLPVLGRLVGIRGFTDEQWPQKMHALAGPHGAGKTTTMLRLALKYHRDNPSARVCLVNADASQGKGRLILRHYADLSGLRFEEFHGADDFQDLLSRQDEFDKIFFDLPGMVARQTLDVWLEERGINSEDFCVHLVLNPYYAPNQLKTFAKKYQTSMLSSLIWTKLDESCCFGSLINMAFVTGLPASALGFGPGLKNTLAPAESNTFWKLIFKHQLPDTQSVDAGETAC
ncbi:hypothetical protein [Desulfovibrio inopinatus]|uniref:flagellar biosynthesis protein FlhF n=1 Tax=Desulfovibrio inopinatus TaxID=102109 RepID=UPI0003FDB47A|nr:hypothetical protein [Desulfovibrio inopinatus]